mgnify:CR=1 FL=1
MSADRINLHATAITVDEIGILFVGPSGSGKSSLAFAFLTEARYAGQSSALIADDQIFVSQQQDGTIIAERPASIAGLLELRGSGIVLLDSIEKATLHYAVMVLAPNDKHERLPPENEMYALPCGGRLPVTRIQLQCHNPLARFRTLVSNSLYA